jgi:RNA polymerase sigma-70 factor (ECF subfamily)
MSYHVSVVSGGESVTPDGRNLLGEVTGAMGASGKGTDAAALAAKEKSRAEDEAVLREVQEGGAKAFDRFVDRFGNRIYAFGMRMCGQREDAEDVFQDTLVTVYRKLQTLREPGALSTWLYRIVANSCLGRRRKSKFAPKTELSLEELLPQGGVIEEGPVLPEESGPSGELYRRELQAALEEAVRDLSPDYRIVWLMRDVEGLSTEETAKALDISISNVKMRLHRARLALRKRLASYHPEGASS